ncbi:MAG: protein translocase subunit SecD [Patescibacteria group bacterium]
MAVKQRISPSANQRWKIYGIVALVLISALIVFPVYANKGIDWVNKSANLGLPRFPDNGFNLGLDLQGGAHLIYKADTSVIPDGDHADSVEGVRDVIERRVRGGLGVAEPLVLTTRVGDEYRIIVELPGVTDVSQAIKMIGETPILEFKEENNDSPRDLTAEEKKELDKFNADARTKINEALAAIKNGMKFEEAVSKYTQDDKSKSNGGNLGFVEKQVYPEIYAWAETHKDGEISKETVQSFDGLNIVKRISAKDGEKEVFASHILICYAGTQGCEQKYTKDEAKVKILEVRSKATPQNFADLAKEFSTEPRADEKAGDLGYFAYKQVVPEFAKMAFEMPVGEISSPVETQFGWHIIYKKAEKTPKVYEVARIYVKTKSATDIVPPKSDWKSTGLSGKQLKRAEVAQDQNTGQVQVSLQFDDEGTKLFGDLTERNIGKAIAIFLDGTPISIPVVNESITNGSAVISGSFSIQEAKLLSQRLNSGALPVPVELISQQKVDATLGAESMAKSFKAGIYGLIAVLLYTIIYYRLPGFVAAIALCAYTVLSLAIFKLIGVTLTLSGIAGFVLSIGMAVDANVLIFERLKEELRIGKSLRTAMEEAFVRAWPSIRDSNITTLISCVFMIWMGTGFVQGFAVVLAIGVLVSMFSAIVLTRTMMRALLPIIKEDGNIMFLGYKKKEELTVKQ